MNSPAPYTRLAEYYETIVTDHFSRHMVEYTFRILRRFRFQPESVLELCCGTGTAAVMFAEHGFNVTGLDGSKEMLKIAGAKARAKRLSIRFVNQQLPDFEITSGRPQTIQSFDLVTCYFDSLNYLLKERELKKCFKAVNNHLNPGGLFIFDMNTYRGLKFIWPKNINAGFRDDYAWVWKAGFDDRRRIADLRAVFFAKKGKGWERFEEMHRERAYSNSTIKKLLRETGFDVSGFFRCFKFVKPDSRTTRFAAVARKKRET
jgi:SAM-dependent methyltransferase